jgi:hypothetical protein
VSLLLATASNHTLTVVTIAFAVSFGIGTYGHVIHSRTLILAGILAIACLCIYFVATGEVQTFN